MKIHVKYVASATTQNLTFTPSDFGLTDEEWTEKSEDEKRMILMDNGDNERPYWDVDKYEEEEDGE